MKWYNLKRNKCPKDGLELGYQISKQQLVCPCGFIITADKMNEIVSKMVSGEVDAETEEQFNRE